LTVSEAQLTLRFDPGDPMNTRSVIARIAASLLTALALGACATAPSGPSRTQYKGDAVWNVS
jgi:hypothetical protein